MSTGHASDCAVCNAPAYEPGVCDCGHDEEFQARVQERRRQRMAAIDAMPAELRALVHEYGLNVVKAFVDVGVSKPRHIKHLVETVLDEFSPTRGGSSSQGTRAWREDRT